MKKFVSLLLFLFSALIIFNICFFVCVDYDCNERAWFCYAFFHMAYALSLLTIVFTTHKRLGVLNSMLYTVSTIYLTIATITTIILLANNNIPKGTVVLVYLLEMGVYLISFHYCHLSNVKAEKGIIKELQNSSRHSNWIAELKNLASTSDNDEKVKILNVLIDEIRSSPSSSNSSVFGVDNDIQSQINAIRSDFDNMQIEELYEYKKQIIQYIRSRTEALKNSYKKI